MKVQPVVAFTVAVVVATTLVSGPLVGFVDLTADQSFSGAGLGEGRATVTDVTFPDRVVIEKGDFGSGSYYLRVGTATAEVSEVVGRPILSYQLSIPALGNTKSTIQVLSASSEGEIELAIEESPYGKDQITADSYEGTLSVAVRYGGQEHAIASENVTIEVIE